MKAAVLTKYGNAENIEIIEIEKPIPRENEILIKVNTASLTFADVEFRVGLLPWWIQVIMRLVFGVFRPRGNFVLGQEIAGVVEQIGKNVTRFKNGDEILGSTSFRMGGHAEYIVLKADDTALRVLKPEPLPFETACTIPLGLPHALYFLRKANLQEGQNILINGAGGAIGTYAIQVAKMMNAHVTAVDAGSKLEMMTSVGADVVIDYMINDFSDDDTKYDVIFDIVGRNSFGRCIKSLKQGGFYLSSNPMIHHQLKGIIAKRKKKIKIFSGVIEDSVVLLQEATDLVATHQIRCVIDTVYDFENIVEAHKYAETGEKKGNLVIRIQE